MIRSPFDNFVTLLYTSCIDQEFIPPPATEYLWREENGVLFPITPIGLALPTTEEVYVENRGKCIELLNVSNKVENLEDLVSKQLSDQSGESDYLESEPDEEESDFEF